MDVSQTHAYVIDMATAANFVQTRQSPTRTTPDKKQSCAPSVYEEKTEKIRVQPRIFAVTSSLPASKKGEKTDRFTELLVQEEGSMPTPKEITPKMDENDRYIARLKERFERDEAIKKLPDLSKGVKEVA